MTRPAPLSALIGPARAMAFFLLALGIQLALARAFLPAGSGAEGSTGNRGEAMVTIRAASGALAEMVRQWDRAPQVAASMPRPGFTPRAPDARPAVTARADTPTARAPYARTASPSMLAPPAPPEAAPDMTTVAAPLPPPPPAPRKAVETPPERNPAAPRPPLQGARPGPPEQLRPPRTAAPPRTAGPPRAAQAAQVARGGGKGVLAGRDGRLSRPSLSAGQRRAALLSWGARIRARIARYKRYPPNARAAGQGGNVRVGLVVTRNGALERVAVVRGSGAASLDRAALRAVRDAAPLPRAPGNLPGTRFRFLLTITFRP